MRPISQGGVLRQVLDMDFKKERLKVISADGTRGFNLFTVEPEIALEG